LDLSNSYLAQNIIYKWDLSEYINWGSNLGVSNEPKRKAYEGNDQYSSSFFIRQIIKKKGNGFKSRNGHIDNFIDISDTDGGAFENFYIHINHSNDANYDITHRIYTNDLEDLRPYALASNRKQDGKYINSEISSTNRVILKAMVKYGYQEPDDYDLGNPEGQDKLSNYHVGPQIIFNGKIVWKGENFTIDHKGWLPISCDITPYIVAGYDDDTNSWNTNDIYQHPWRSDSDVKDDVSGGLYPMKAGDITNDQYINNYMHQNILEFCVKKTFGYIDFTFKISNITISLDDTPWWLLTSNDMHVVNNLSVSTVPNPHYSLEVSGNTYIHSGDQTSDTSYTLIVDGSTNITGGDLIVATGNVGIGTATPESALHVVGNIVGSTPTTKGIHIGMNNGLQANIELCSASTSYNSNIDFTVPNSDNKGRILYSHNENNMRFSTNNTEQMRILSSGNVGIGTPLPNYTLDVSGTFNVDVSNTNFTVDSDGNVGIGTTAPTETLNVIGDIQLGNNSGIETRTIKNNSGDLVISTEHVLDLVFDNNNNNTTGCVRFFNESSELMRLNDAGNLGIGRTSPNYTLDVSGTFNVDASDNNFTVASDGNVGIHRPLPNYTLDVSGTFNVDVSNTNFTVDSDGNVGIGTTSPNELDFDIKLEVIGNQMIRHGTTNNRGYVELRFNNNGLDQGSGAGLLLASNCPSGFNAEAIIDTWKSGVSGNAPILFKTRGTERMRIVDGNDPSVVGNVGIGTDGPNYTLDVSGTFNVDASDNNDFIVASNGNVGIHRTTLPNYTLDVSGTFNVDVSNTNFTVDSDGNVGIGTSSPSSSLQVKGSSATFETVAAASGIKFIPSSYVTSASDTQNDDVPFIANPPAMINSEYIDYINSLSDFVVDATTNGIAHFQLAGGDSKQRSIILSAGRCNSTSTSANFYNIQAWAAQAKLSNNLSLQALGGNVGIGKTSPSYTLDVSGTFNVDVNGTGTGNNFTVDSNGNVGIGTSPSYQLDVSGAITTNDMMTAKSYTANSDETLKENIKILTDPLEKILQLEGKIYNWKKDKEKRQHAGLIAQEVEQHIKEVVIDDHADGKKGIDYNGLIPYLVECIKTQQKQIDTLNDRIASLENK